MYFKQIMVPGMGCYSYVIGCPAAKEMVVVDPKRDVRDYLDISREEGMRITHIFNTHLHADHISGDQELRSQTGAEIHIHGSANVDYPHTPLKEGDVFTFGSARMEVIHTPGHTPNSVSFLVTDTMRSNEPWMILTGDLLFVGDIGRPDLPGAEILDEQVANLYDSLYNKLGKYPDHLEVFPAHGQGSLCGKGMSSKGNSTLGYERAANPMLKFDNFESFKKTVMGEFPARPKSFSHIINTNLHGAPLLDRCPVEQAMNPDRFAEEMEKGAVVIDTRDAAAFGGMHIPGSLSIGFEKQIANWVGMVVEPGSRILLVVNGKEDYDHMCTILHRIGYDDIYGYLLGGMQSWVFSGKPVRSLPQVSVTDLAERLTTDNLRLIDVRTPAERKAGQIKGSEYHPLSDVLDKGLDIAPDENVVVYCGSGYRSNIVASSLQQTHCCKVSSLAGGVFAWVSAGFALEE
jgi:glyoxylase-like metal-dependent hydrolase (beta-lactamase superfamily II)/rhodanese-related sulfurtransferase